MVTEFGCLQPCKVAVAIVVVEVVVVVVAVVEVVVNGGSRSGSGDNQYQTQQQLAKRASTFNHRIARLHPNDYGQGILRCCLGLAVLHCPCSPGQVSSGGGATGSPHPPNANSQLTLCTVQPSARLLKRLKAS